MDYYEDNIFAKILRKEQPCHKVYENEYTVAFLDIMPQLPGHTLVIPRENAVTIYDLSDEAALECIKTVRLVSMALEACFQKKGSTIFQHNGEIAGQTVPHFHFHVLPGNIIEAPLMKGHAARIATPENLESVAFELRSQFDNIQTN